MRTAAKIIGLGIYGVCGVLVLMFLLPFGGWKALNVLTGSMRPNIQPGDLVITHRVPLNSIHTGDIVTYTNPANPRQTITHRVVGRQAKQGVPYIITKGDANAGPDLAFPGGRIVGRTAVIVPAAGRVSGWLRSPLAIAAIVVVPGLLVIFGEVQMLRRRLGAMDTTAQAANARSMADAPDPVKPATSKAAAAARTLPHPQPKPPQRRPLVHLTVALGLGLALATGATYAADTSTVALAGNTLSAKATPKPTLTPRPTAKPIPSPVVSPCVANNQNNIVITNNNSQTANASGSGNASNTNETNTVVTINNTCIH